MVEAMTVGVGSWLTIFDGSFATGWSVGNSHALSGYGTSGAMSVFGILCVSSDSAADDCSDFVSSLPNFYCPYCRSAWVIAWGLS